MWTEEREVRDTQEGISDNEKTLDLIREETNKLIPGLKFTVDCQERNGDNRCPMLDLKVWKEIGHDGCVVIRHTFFEKDVTSP